MRSSCFRLSIPVLFMLVFAAGAHAQATRTWISGVGDDVNPCSRTAPCKTFAGAISKTAAGGEINTLDPGGYGGVTITKAITLDGAGTHASILASSSNGITVNAGVNDIVTIRNISINGAPPTSSGLRGIRIVQAKAVIIENCTIFGFRGSPGRGIDINLSTGSTIVIIRNTTITGNLAAGVAVVPITGQPAVQVMISNSNLSNNASGIFAGEGAQFTIAKTVVSNNSVVGIDAAGSTVPSVVNVDDTVIAYNARGILTNGGATVRLSRNQIFGNPVRGFELIGGVINTFSDNTFASNGPNLGALTPLGKQ